MALSIRAFGMLMLCLIFLTVYSPRTAIAQVDVKTTEALAKSREQYEFAMDRIRREVRSQLDAMKEQAKRLKDNTEAVARALQAAKDFEGSGAIPDCKSRDKISQEYAKVAAAMRKAYNDAKLAQGGEEAFGAEAEQFDTNWDLVPWQDNITREGRPEVGSTPIAFESGVAGDYRLEIKAKRASDSGTLFIEIPAVTGKRVKVPAVTGEKGDVRVLLTVREGLVSADLGVARPIDLSNTVNGNGNQISLSVDSGAFVVEAVRVKPVVGGTPPEVKKPTRHDSNREQSRQVDLYSQGKSWRGNFDGDWRVVRLTGRSGDRVTFECPGSFQGSLWKIEGVLRGGVVVVDNIDRIKNPPNHPPVKTRSPTGTIRINSDGTLDMFCTVRGSDGRNNNWEGKFVCKAAAPQ